MLPSLNRTGNNFHPQVHNKRDNSNQMRVASRRTSTRQKAEINRGI